MKRNISYLIFLIFSILLTACSHSIFQYQSGFFKHTTPLENSTFNNTYENSKIDLVFSPDNKWLASYQLLGYKHAVLKVWNTHSGKLTYATKIGGKKGYNDTTLQTTIRFTSDSKTILLEGQIGPIVIWNFTTNKETINGCSAEYVFIDSISPDKTQVYISTIPGYEILCDMASNKEYFSGRISSSTVVLTDNKLLSISPSSKVSVSSGDPGNPIGWVSIKGSNPELINAKKRAIFKESSQYIDFWILNLAKFDSKDRPYEALIFPARHQYILYDIKDKTISQWNYKTRKRNWKKKLKELPTINKNSSDTLTLQSHPGKQKIAIQSPNKLLVLDSNTGNILWKKALNGSPPHKKLRFTHNGKYLITHHNTTKVYSAETGKKLHELLLKNKPSPYYHYKISPNGEYIIETISAGIAKVPTIIASDLSYFQSTTFEGEAYPIAYSTNGKIAYIEHGNQIKLRDSGF